MRKHIKKRIYEILDSMNEIHTFVRDNMACGNTLGIIELLGENQSAAIKIGELIEEAEGEGTTTVFELEDYCEELYLICRDLNNLCIAGEVYGKLHGRVEQVRESICRDIPVTYEMVFLPYKASMWDSLESVWKAADADSNVKAYVVSVPYFVMNPNRTFGKMFDERELYPSDVPVLSWKQYNIKERMPDAVFVHNPYDNRNYVTSVHPDYYTSNLKKYTDMLVYIPYFISLENVEEHFCTLPAVVYSNRVIVQSEKVRDTYTRCFGDWIRERGYENLFPHYEDKFLPLGSPKLERVESAKRDECLVPEEWRDLISSAYENGRKVILFNTTISALLNGNESVLDKIVEVLNIFKKNGKVLLLWRPHPLNVATYKSMRPGLLERYGRIVERYRREGWGIYDDTPDLNRAIALSDAYYGDWSSVVALYRVTGKPIMIQDVRILTGGQK